FEVMLPPVDPVGSEAGQRPWARLADAAIIVKQDIPAMLMQVLGKPEIVAAAHRCGRVDNGQRACRVDSPGMAPLAPSKRVAVCGRNRYGAGHGPPRQVEESTAPTASPIRRTAHSVRGVKTEA